jgi:uncharacterized protein YndB with AHSA1/START domain
MLQIPSSKLQFVVVRDIEANVERVFDVVTSEAGMKAWIPLCRSAQWRYPMGVSAPGVGSVRFIRLVAGIYAAERIVAWEAGRELHYTFDATTLPFDKLTRGYVGVMRVDPVGANRTRLTWSVYFDTPGRLNLLAPMVRASLRAFIGLMASKLKRASEVC